MVALRKTNSALARGGMYLVVRAGSGPSALVDADLPVEMNRLKAAVENIGKVLMGVSSESVAVSIKFQPWPNR